MDSPPIRVRLVVRFSDFFESDFFMFGGAVVGGGVGYFCEFEGFGVALARRPLAALSEEVHGGCLEVFFFLWPNFFFFFPLAAGLVSRGGGGRKVFKFSSSPFFFFFFFLFI